MNLHPLSRGPYLGIIVPRLVYNLVDHGVGVFGIVK
jgi:hypothetical protein